MFKLSWVYRGHIFRLFSLALRARNSKMKAEIVKELNSSRSLRERGARRNRICDKIPRAGRKISKWEARDAFLFLLMAEAKESKSQC